MPFGTEIARTTAYPPGKWVVSCKIWASCGCYYTRKSVLMYSETEPTRTEILEALKNEPDDDDQD